MHVSVFSAPFSFAPDTIITVPEGTSVRETAQILKDEKVVRSRAVFEATVRLWGGKSIAGKYSFQRPASVFSVGWRFARGDFRITPIRVKVVEGSTVRDIATLLGEKLPGFSDAEFMRLAGVKEGYLFPDTYFILPGATPETIIKMMEGAFDKAVESSGVARDIEYSGMPLHDVITMASLLEKEVPGTQDRRVIAGILWKRLELGMPLQIDAVFPYIIGKNSFELTRADLAIDSPYNTYLYKGLPIGPIANPSLDAIVAAVTPIETEYLFYLSDFEGNMHYSSTYEQHLVAKQKYLGT
jgi:UPF0755 protein